MSDNKTYLMRRKALEGDVFYHNKLTDPAYVKKYFPPTQQEPNYEMRPKIAVPITSTFVNRIASTLHNGMTVEFTNPQLQQIWDDLSKQLEWDEMSRNLLVLSLVEGNTLAVIRQSETQAGVFPVIETWKGEYVFDIMDSHNVGYEYILKNNSPIMIPVISEPKLGYGDVLVSTLINDTMFGNFEHNLGFTPAVMFKNIDRDEDGNYGVPYFMRYRDLNIEYNHIISQVSKAIKIMQNVWIVKGNAINNDNPLRLNPDTLNYVGADGDLIQAVRQLNTDPENAYMNGLMRLIHNSAQIPDFMSGLTGVGKIESGVALQIVSTPLIELVTRIRSEYKEDVIELIGKLMSCLYLFNGTTPPELDFDVKFNESIIPVDKQQEIDNIIKLVQAGIVPAELVQEKALKLIGE